MSSGPLTLPCPPTILSISAHRFSRQRATIRRPLRLSSRLQPAPTTPPRVRNGMRLPNYNSRLHKLQPLRISPRFRLDRTIPAMVTARWALRPCPHNTLPICLTTLPCILTILRRFRRLRLHGCPMPIPCHITRRRPYCITRLTNPQPRYLHTLPAIRRARLPIQSVRLVFLRSRPITIYLKNRRHLRTCCRQLRIPRLHFNPSMLLRPLLFIRTRKPRLGARIPSRVTHRLAPYRDLPPQETTHRLWVNIAPQRVMAGKSPT
jgi:hypothetical protein